MKETFLSKLRELWAFCLRCRNQIKAPLDDLVDEIEIAERVLGFSVVKSDTLAKARKLLNRKEFTISTNRKEVT